MVPCLSCQRAHDGSFVRVCLQWPGCCWLGNVRALACWQCCKKLISLLALPTAVYGPAQALLSFSLSDPYHIPLTLELFGLIAPVTSSPCPFSMIGGQQYVFSIPYWPLPCPCSHPYSAHSSPICT